MADGQHSIQGSSELEQISPVGDGDYHVRQGDCLESIGFAHGLMPDTIWNHPRNEAVRAARNPNDLLPGDRLFIPELEARVEDAASEARHRYRRRGVPSVLKLRLTEEDGDPRADVPWVLSVDGRTFSGRTDADGRIEQRIPPDARRVELSVDGEEPVLMDLGHVDPIESLRGVQVRLANLGFNCGSETTIGEQTRKALRAFQARAGLEPTGVLDATTRAAIKDAHGS